MAHPVPVGCDMRGAATHLRDRSPSDRALDAGRFGRERQLRSGVECNRADAPRLTASIHIALEDLGLDRVAVVYPGAERYALSQRVEAVPLDTLAEPGRLFGETLA